jgi:hypothetical protein
LATPAKTQPVCRRIDVDDASTNSTTPTVPLWLGRPDREDPRELRAGSRGEAIAVQLIFHLLTATYRNGEVTEYAVSSVYMGIIFIYLRACLLEFTGVNTLSI